MVWDGSWDRNKVEIYLNLVVRDWESFNTCLIRMARSVVDNFDMDMFRIFQFLFFILDPSKADWCHTVRLAPFVLWAQCASPFTCHLHWGPLGIGVCSFVSNVQHFIIMLQHLQPSKLPTLWAWIATHYTCPLHLYSLPFICWLHTPHWFHKSHWYLCPIQQHHNPQHIHILKVIY